MMRKKLWEGENMEKMRKEEEIGEERLPEKDRANEDTTGQLEDKTETQA